MEKSDDIYWQIFHIFNMKCVMSGLITSNPISRKSLRPILANFMTVPILLLSATLTPNETSVGGIGDTVGENSKCHRVIKRIKDVTGNSQSGNW